MQGLDRRAGLRGVVAQSRHLLLGLTPQVRQGLTLSQEFLAGLLHELAHRQVGPLGQGALGGLHADQAACDGSLVLAERVDHAHDFRQVPAELLAQHGVLRGRGEGRARQFLPDGQALWGRGAPAVHAAEAGPTVQAEAGSTVHAERLRDPHVS